MAPTGLKPTLFVKGSSFPLLIALLRSVLSWPQGVPSKVPMYHMPACRRPIAVNESPWSSPTYPWFHTLKMAGSHLSMSYSLSVSPVHYKLFMRQFAQFHTGWPLCDCLRTARRVAEPKEEMSLPLPPLCW